MNGENSNNLKIYVRDLCLIIKHETERKCDRGKKFKNKRPKKSRAGLWGKFNEFLDTSIKTKAKLPANLEFSKRELIEMLADYTCFNFKNEGHDTFSSPFVQEQIRRVLEEKLNIRTKNGFDENNIEDKKLEIVYQKYVFEKKEPLKITDETGIQYNEVKEVIKKIETWKKDIRLFRFDLREFADSLNRWLRKYGVEEEFIERVGQDFRLNILSASGPSTLKHFGSPFSLICWLHSVRFCSKAEKSRDGYGLSAGV